MNSLDLILFLLIPAAFILGGRCAVWAMCRIDSGVALPIDDQPFLADWERELLDDGQPFSAGDETDIVQAVRLSDGRPKPYPPLRAVE